MKNHLQSLIERGRAFWRQAQCSAATLAVRKQQVLRVLPIAAMCLMVLLMSGVALAAPAPTSGTSQQGAGQTSARSGSSAQNQPLAATPTPICVAGRDDSTTCAQNLTTTLSSGAKAFYVIGVWVAIVVAVLVIIWTTPGTIVGAATSNSKVVGQLVTRIAIIVGLILLAINSWTILQFFLGASGQSISPPSFPTVTGG